MLLFIIQIHEARFQGGSSLKFFFSLTNPCLNLTSNRNGFVEVGDGCSIGKCGYSFSLSVKFGPVQLKIWFQWFDSLASLCIIVPSQSLGVTVDAYVSIL